MPIILILCLALSSPVCAETLTATVIKVTDGDTVKVELNGEMPELFRHQSVRVLGCDTPEKRDPRPGISALAYQAKDFTASKVTAGSILELHDIAFDKYGGRLLARIKVEGEDLCRMLIDAGLAKPYDGGKKEW